MLASGEAVIESRISCVSRNRGGYIKEPAKMASNERLLITNGRRFDFQAIAARTHVDFKVQVFG